MSMKQDLDEWAKVAKRRRKNLKTKVLATASGEIWLPEIGEIVMVSSLPALACWVTGHFANGTIEVRPTGEPFRAFESDWGDYPPFDGWDRV